MQAAGECGSESGESDAVWSQDIEEAFEEALLKYPPCGRRKIELIEEGRMYGRNELIAKYINQKTGKHRTRKQVSSHIQVLARKRQREARDGSSQQNGTSIYAGLSSAEIVSHSVKAGTFGKLGGVLVSGDKKKEKAVAREIWTRRNRHASAPTDNWLLMTQFTGYIKYPDTETHNFVDLQGHDDFADPSTEMLDILQIWDKFPGLRELYAKGPKDAFFLVKFWANVHYEKDMLTEDSGFFGIDSEFVSDEPMNIECSTSVVSLGRQVVEKIETVEGRLEDGHAVYRFTASPMCPYMISFIEKLRNLDNPELMNRVLENFSVVQVVRDIQTEEVLLCTAFLFEISLKGFGTRHYTYRLYEGESDSAA